MNIITTEAIAKIINEKYHPGSLHYLQTLLEPLAKQLELQPSIENITNWVNKHFRAGREYHIIDEMKRVQRELVETLEANGTIPKGGPHDYNTPQFVTLARIVIIDSILTRIVSLNVNIETIIYPWDIQESISLDEEFSDLFTITKKDTTLPISVHMGPQTFTHMMSKELMAGLQLFSRLSGKLFKLTMFGGPMELTTTPDIGTFFDTLVGKPDFYYLCKRVHGYPYCLTVKDATYHFIALEFMQGFITGALWAGVDHHAYWTKLEQERISENGDKTTVTLSI